TQGPEDCGARLDRNLAQLAAPIVIRRTDAVESRQFFDGMRHCLMQAPADARSFSVFVFASPLASRLRQRESEPHARRCIAIRKQRTGMRRHDELTACVN